MEGYKFQSSPISGSAGVSASPSEVFSLLLGCLPGVTPSGERSPVNVDTMLSFLKVSL